ncbi:MAG TPA: class I SAM-dependent methyltransferase [Gemmatimonadales bacterium]|nr:class I SAM-dependent methyltransferase [Gemmatimonadales bacterium]
MSLGERLLRRLSRPVNAPDLDSNYDADPKLDNALNLLRRVYPALDADVRDRVILDFGCGVGAQAIALARLGARRVVGLDTNPRLLKMARDAAAAHHIQHRVRFQDHLTPDLIGAFDIVISQNSMEHFPDPEAILGEMERALAPSGEIWITFGPPWFAPYGSHTQFFTKLPWVNLLFSEETVMRVRSQYRSDGARRYEEVESGLNRMTLRKFERLVQSAGLVEVYRLDECVKQLNLFRSIPFLRELLVNHVTCKLKTRTPAALGAAVAS